MFAIGVLPNSQLESFCLSQEKETNSLVKKPVDFSNFCQYIGILYFSAHPNSFMYCGSDLVAAMTLS